MSNLDTVAMFHAHLDGCLQCRDNPFGLCADGAKLLREAATSPRVTMCTRCDGRTTCDEPCDAYMAAAVGVKDGELANGDDSPD